MERAIIQNTFPAHDKDSGLEYATLENGLHVLGLVSIKNIMRKPYKEGDPDQPGYRLTFRSHETPNAFVNVEFNATSGPKSTAYKLLKTMSGGILAKESSNQQLFDFMVSCLGHWFNVMTVQNAWAKNPEVVFVNVLNNAVMPDKKSDKELGDAIRFFGADTPPKEATYIPSAEEKARIAHEDDNIPF